MAAPSSSSKQAQVPAANRHNMVRIKGYADCASPYRGPRDRMSGGHDARQPNDQAERVGPNDRSIDSLQCSSEDVPIPNMTDAPRRRRMSFSLRAMMVLVLVVSLAFAAMKPTIDRARRQRLSAQAVAQWAIVRYDYEYEQRPVKGPPWLRNLLGEDFFDKVAEVIVTDPTVDDFSRLADFPQLRRLYANDVQVNDLMPLAGLTHLEELHLRNSQAEDLAPLANLDELQALYLDGTQVEDLTPLSNLDSLRMLSLIRTPVEDVSPLAGATSLQLLSLNSTDVHDLAPLAGLHDLKQVTLVETRTNAEHAMKLQKQLPNCRVVFKPRPDSKPNDDSADAAAEP